MFLFPNTREHMLLTVGIESSLEMQSITRKYGHAYGNAQKNGKLYLPHFPWYGLQVFRRSYTLDDVSQTASQFLSSPRTMSALTC